MPHWLIEGSAIADRVLAGLLGCLCFYMAFFLYEDQDGIWQDRIDGFWLKVYDRAKITDSTTTALFNKIGDFLYRVFSRLFGKRLLSFHAVALSIDLSLIGLTLYKVVSLIMEIVADVKAKMEPSDFYVYTVTLLLGLIVVPATTAILIRTRFWWLHIVLIIECGYILSNLDLMWMGSTNSTATEAVLLSLLSDFLVLMIVKKVLSFISRSLSIVRIVTAVSALSAVIIWFLIMPAVGEIVGLLWINSSNRTVVMFTSTISVLCGELRYLNLATVIYCVVPLVMFVVVLLHRVTWPALSKMIYPLCRNKIVSNKKVLSSVGALCFTFAFNVAPVGLKEILNLFP